MYKKILIPLMFLCSLPLIAEQTARRLENPWQVTVFPVLRPYATFSHAFDERFNFGLTIASGGQSEDSEIVTSTDAAGCSVPDFLNLSVCQKSVKRQPSGFLFLNYFPFDSPFFLGAFVGRSGGETQRYTEYASFETPALGLSTQAPVVYTITEEAYYLAGPSLGARYIFAGGPILAGEAWFAALSPHENQVYISHDLRSFASQYTPLSPADLLVSQAWLQNAAEPPAYALNLLVHFGFAF